MTEVSERYATIADDFTGRLQSVTQDRWTAPSPCTEWTARDVAVHVINTHRRVMSSLDQSEPAVFAAEAPDHELLLAWSEASANVRNALADDAKANQTISGIFGEQPFHQLVGRLLCADTLVHTWDLARATGQDERLDADAVAKAAEFLTPIDEAIRRPGGFAPKIESKPDADDQTRFLNFAGRAV